MNTDNDLQNDNASVNAPELLLGLGLLSLGTYFVFRSASRSGHGVPLPQPCLPHHVPIDIAIRPTNDSNRYQGKVTQDYADQGKSTYLDIAYSPIILVKESESDSSCTILAGNTTYGEFKFTAAENSTGRTITVTASVMNETGATCSVSRRITL